MSSTRSGRRLFRHRCQRRQRHPGPTVNPYSPARSVERLPRQRRQPNQQSEFVGEPGRRSCRELAHKRGVVSSHGDFCGFNQFDPGAIAPLCRLRDGLLGYRPLVRLLRGVPNHQRRCQQQDSPQPSLRLSTHDASGSSRHPRTRLRFRERALLRPSRPPWKHCIGNPSLIGDLRLDREERDLSGVGRPGGGWVQPGLPKRSKAQSGQTDQRGLQSNGHEPHVT